MLEMEEKILNEGEVLPGGILKVGSFLNQQIDTAFLK
jgi:xanthine phosphoribosyltransferase